MNKSWVEKLLSRPYFIYSFLTLFSILGLIGYQNINRKLFPESNYPEIAVVLVQPSSSAQTIASTIAVPVEEELYTLDSIRRVYSTTIDEVCVVHAEFEYTKNLELAASDVSTALEKIKSNLPADMKAPQIHKISATTAPIITIAISSPKQKQSLEDIRLLADNIIKPKMLTISGVANIDVFGGFKKEIQIIIDKHKLDLYGLSLQQILKTIQSNNKDYAIGYISNQSSRYLLKSAQRNQNIQGLKALQITHNLKLEDIAEISFKHYENTAEYYGNGKPAIAIAIQRGADSDVVKTINHIEKELHLLQSTYHNLNFEITDTQKDTIEQSTNNMFDSLRDAILMSTFVVFIFLASFRQVLVVLITIPLVYATTIALMWLVGIEFNVVTLTGIILALGLLLDDAVVVMENIERHYCELGSNINKAVLNGTKEIMFADFSGTITTMIALAPILFVGGYPQTVFRPLTTTLLLALTASYIISISAVPLISLKLLTIKHPIILKSEAFFNKLSNTGNEYIQSFFATAVRNAIEKKAIAIVYFVSLLILFIISIRIVMPLIGRELMPPMDTGGIKINITTEPNLPITKSQIILKQVHKILQQENKLDYLSSSIGSEAGVLSIGSGAGTDHISIIATYVNRYKRKETIWEIARHLRPLISKIEHIKRFEVIDYGATAMASIRANVDVMLQSTNFDDLIIAGTQVKKALFKTKGIVSVSQTWDKDKTVYNLNVNHKQALHYGLNDQDITNQLKTVLQGSLISTFPSNNSNDFKIRIWLPLKQRDTISTLQTLLIDTPNGNKIPLASVANIERKLEPDTIKREGLFYTLNIYGFREKSAISHIMNEFETHLKDINLPPSVKLTQMGDLKEFKNSAGRMASAIGFAVVLIFFTLITFFDSIKISLMIILSIPLTIIGAAWTLLALNYHISMPAMMGFILLSGVIVNNAILLIHFAQEKITDGMSRYDAMLESIRIRTRPVLMTAFSVAAGMLPVALGSAIGLERLAPLGAVAIGGLLIGTFLTLIFIPLVFIWLVKK